LTFARVGTEFARVGREAAADARAPDYPARLERNEDHMEIAVLRDKLRRAGQSQVVRFFDRLPDAGKRTLVSQLDALDLDDIAELAESHVRHKAHIALPKKIEPVQAYPRTPRADQHDLYQRAEERGRELLRQGKVAAFLVAGGQGTRLGYDGPKGEFPVTPVKHKPLFQVFAEQLRAHARDAGRGPQRDV
jgi:UDP-N-acetylglucosamine/UDP-N-acetylgalactosamine diphosphorylase